MSHRAVCTEHGLGTVDMTDTMLNIFFSAGGWGGGRLSGFISAVKTSARVELHKRMKKLFGW